MSISTRQIIHFNQLYDFRDCITGGNCFAYTSLVFSYISMFNKKYPDAEEVDYGRLLDVLKGFPFSKRKMISDHQDLHASKLHMIKDEIAILSAIDILYYRDLSGLAADIHNLKDKNKSRFCFISFWDTNQKILGQEIHHSVFLYIPDPYTLHFFDSLSGIHIIELPFQYNPEELTTCFKDLIFKKNFLMRWGCDAESRTLGFCFYHSTKYPGFENPEIEGYLNKLIENPKLLLDELKISNYTKSFLELNAFALQMLALKPTFSFSEKKILQQISQLLGTIKTVSALPTDVSLLILTYYMYIETKWRTPLQDSVSTFWATKKGASKETPAIKTTLSLS